MVKIVIDDMWEVIFEYFGIFLEVLMIVKCVEVFCE